MILGAIGGSSTITWLITFLANRKTNLLNVINSLTEQLKASDGRTKERDVKVDYVYSELRKEQSEKLELLRKLHEIELKFRDAEIKRCDIPRCPNRQPPSDY